MYIHSLSGAQSIVQIIFELDFKIIRSYPKRSNVDAFLWLVQSGAQKENCLKLLLSMSTKASPVTLTPTPGPLRTRTLR